MIRLIREGSVKYPWILVGIMGVIVVTFVVGMGWFGYGEVQRNKVATVGDVKISRDDYERAYRQAQDLYRENKQEITPEQLEDLVVSELISTKVWALAGDALGLTVTPDELRANILGIQAFQRNGRFDPDVYRRLLSRNHLTPGIFEAIQREQLLVAKTRRAVAESVALTPDEQADAEMLVGHQAPGTESTGGLSKDLIVKSFLFQKQQRALEAYTASLRTTIPIEIFRENL